MKIKVKTWIEKDGKLIFGRGKEKILQAIQETSSLNKAAKKLNMSYRAAWSHIKAIEKRTGKQLLIRQKGGKSGGGAELTPFAEELIEKFEKLDNNIKIFSENKFKEIFGDSNGNI